MFRATHSPRSSQQDAIHQPPALKGCTPLAVNLWVRAPSAAVLSLCVRRPMNPAHAYRSAYDDDDEWCSDVDCEPSEDEGSDEGTLSRADTVTPLDQSVLTNPDPFAQLAQLCAAEYQLSDGASDGAAAGEGRASGQAVPPFGVGLVVELCVPHGLAGEPQRVPCSQPASEAVPQFVAECRFGGVSKPTAARLKRAQRDNGPPGAPSTPSCFGAFHAEFCSSVEDEDATVGQPSHTRRKLSVEDSGRRYRCGKLLTPSLRLDDMRAAISVCTLPGVL